MLLYFGTKWQSFYALLSGPQSHKAWLLMTDTSDLVPGDLKCFPSLFTISDVSCALDIEQILEY